MTHPEPDGVRETAPTAEPTDRSTDEPAGPPPDWWHRDHPTFTALTGFFTGMLFVTVVPGGFAGLLRLLFHYDTAERLFPLIAIALVVPAALVANGRTRRFGLYMVLGMVITALVLLGVTSLVLYFMVRYDG